MQKRERAARSTSASELPFAVPFAWEETPGVPKETHRRTMSNLPLKSPPHTLPLRKPPCLQDAALCKPRTSFSSPSPHDQARHGFSPKPLVRKQSFSRILPLASTTLVRKYSVSNLVPHHHAPLVRLEDDPFFMAFQACQKESIRVYFHDRHGTYGNANATVQPTSQLPHRSHTHTGNSKLFTIGQLCTLHIQEEEELKKAQREPLIVSHNFQRRHKKGRFSILFRCLGC